MTTEDCLQTKTLALQLGNGDEHRALESDTTGLNVRFITWYDPAVGTLDGARSMGLVQCEIPEFHGIEIADPRN